MSTNSPVSFFQRAMMTSEGQVGQSVPYRRFTRAAESRANRAIPTKDWASKYQMPKPFQVRNRMALRAMTGLAAWRAGLSVPRATGGRQQGEGSILGGVGDMLMKDND